MAFNAKQMVKHWVQSDLFLFEPSCSFTKNGYGEPIFFYVPLNAW